MRYSAFSKKLKSQLYGATVSEEVKVLGESVTLLEDGRVLVNGKPTELESLEEARQYIKQIKLEEELTRELYEDIPDVKIAKLINEHHDVKVTEKLIESYIELASSKLFTVDPVVLGIRTLNSLDQEIEGKIDYMLDDGSSVAIDEDTNRAINNLLADKSEIVSYMRESKENFMHIIREIS